MGHDLALEGRQDGLPCFDAKLEGQVAHIVLNRPDGNSMIPEFWDELAEIVRGQCPQAPEGALVHTPIARARGSIVEIRASV